MKAIYPPDFECFWSVYPNKQEKMYAAKCHAKLILCGVNSQDIIDGAKRYAAWLKSGDDKNWRPQAKNASTWLNRGCWEDEYDTPQQISQEDSPVASRWRARVQGWRKNGFWPETYGPRPGEPNCECPVELLN